MKVGPTTPGVISTLANNSHTVVVFFRDLDQTFQQANRVAVNRPRPLRVVTGLSAPIAGESAGYRLRDGVVLIIAADGTGRLLDLAGDACALSVSAVAIVECALQAEFDEVSRRIAARFRVELGQIRSDVTTLLSELVDRRMLVPSANTSYHRPATSAGLRRLLAPVLVACMWAPRRALAVKAWVLLAAAFFATRLFGWPKTVDAWLHLTAGRRTNGSLTAHDDAAALDAIERAVVRAIASYPIEVNCKERALCCRVLACAAGVVNKVILGIDLMPFALHCWCECDSRILADRADGIYARFTPFMVYS
jgi:hypothetical protein